MRSALRGRSTSEVEVSNVSRHGFWLLLGDRELFVGFEQFPWFRDVAVGKIWNVELQSPAHLYWPDLDIDLDVESIEHPERFPLVSRTGPSNARQRTHSGRSFVKAKRPRRVRR